MTAPRTRRLMGSTLSGRADDDDGVSRLSAPQVCYSHDLLTLRHCTCVSRAEAEAVGREIERLGVPNEVAQVRYEGLVGLQGLQGTLGKKASNSVKQPQRRKVIATLPSVLNAQLADMYRVHCQPNSCVPEGIALAS